MPTMVDQITQFKMAVYQHCPYLAPYVYSLTPTERPGLGTMAVDRYGRLYFDPAFCERLSLEQGGYVVLHEAWHLVLRHCHRAKGIVGENPTPQEAHDLNIAYDIVVWEMLEAIADHAPEGGVTFDKAKAKWPEIERNMAAEALYAIIASSRRDQASDRMPSSDEFCNESGDGHCTDDSSRAIDNDGFTLLGGGSAADGQPRDYEEEPDLNWDAFKEGRLLEATEEKIQQLEEDREWNGGCGTVPSELKRLIKSQLHPQPNPWEALRSTAARIAANHRGATDWSYRRVSRRQYSDPNMHRLKGASRHSAKAVVGVDSSGSMTPECLRKAIRVIQQGLKALGKVPVVTCDAAVGQDITVTHISDDFEFMGGGGTDLRVLLEYAEKKHRPDVVVLVTDGGTPWPTEPTRHQLVIALTQECPTPSWATTVRIPQDPTKESLDDE